MGAYKWFMQSEFGSARSRDKSFTGRKLAKVHDFLNRYISVNTDLMEVIFDHIINCLSFGYVRLPQL